MWPLGLDARGFLWKLSNMVARAYTTTLSNSDEWSGPRLEIASVPAPSTASYSVGDLVGSLGLEAVSVADFEALGEVRDFLVQHFAEAGLGDLVALAFEDDFVVVEESPGKAVAMSAVAGAGAIAAGFAIFGPWAIITIPVGVFLLAAAPEAGQGFGQWVGDWFRSRTPNHP